MFPAKFSRLEDGEHVPHDYGDSFFEQPCGAATRLVIGPSRDHVELLTELAACFAEPRWYVLYVLLVPRLGNRPSGRYQSEPFEDHAELASFLASFKAFFEGDGRHHVWVGSTANEGLLVYDQHDVVFAYGPIDAFRPVLESRGFRESGFWFPSPHAHAYSPDHDAEEERLMNERRWDHFPLQPGDAWS